MSGSFFDASWYRAADLKPRLRAHVEIHRQRFRGQTWFVVQDHQSGRFHRLSPAGHLIASLMDGERTVAEVWDLAGERLGEEQPSQTETIQLLSQLYRADLLLGDIPPDIEELARRGRKQQRRKLWQQLATPTSVRIPLWDPDRFLDATLPWLGWVFGPVGAVLWLALVATGGSLALLHWSELTVNVADRVLAASNFVSMVVTYCAIKALHEFGHGYALKRWGGEVHEMGIIFLVFFPVPYVDASTSSSFRSRWQRATVGAAGILVELAIAAGAMVAWTLLEPGAARAIAYNAMAIAGVSTLLVNGNPLLRFDGYYVLSDWLEIPNLGTRSNRYFAYLVQSRLLGIPDVTSPATAPGEARWFFCYGLAAYLYRFVLVFTIAFFVAGTVPLVGMALGLWIVVSGLLMPIYKAVRFLLVSPAIQRRRGRVLLVVGGSLATLATLLWLLPVPHTTVVEGVLFVPDHASVRAGTAGFVVRVLATPNALVKKGDALVRIEDPQHDTKVEVLETERAEFSLRLLSVPLEDRVQRQVLREQLERVEGKLAAMREQARRQTIRAQNPGRFVLPAASDLPGRFVPRGTQLGYVLDDLPPLVRVLVDQDDIDPVRESVEFVDVRFFEHPEMVVSARIERETPAAVENTPSQALATLAGGDIALDPTDPESARLLERMFQIELTLAQSPPTSTVGGRVLVRFDHGRRALGPRVARRLRQIFLRQLDV